MAHLSKLRFCISTSILEYNSSNTWLTSPERRLVGLFLIRSGRLVDKQVLPLDKEEELEEILLGFYYTSQLPKTLMVNFELSEEALWWLRLRGSFNLI